MPRCLRIATLLGTEFRLVIRPDQSAGRNGLFTAELIPTSSAGYAKVISPVISRILAGFSCGGIRTQNFQRSTTGMYCRYCLWALFTGLITTWPVAGQVSHQEALASMQVVDGMQVELFASEPMFVNPTVMDIDHRGRVWVCESVNYRYTIRGEVGPDGERKMRNPKGDRIVVLEDSDEDGKADRVTTFYQSPDFLAPLGIAVAPEADGVGMKVYICHSPHIYVFHDRDGDLKADGKPEILLTGFQGYDHDHGVHGISIAPDGKLYFSVGDQGIKDLRAADGEGPVWASNNSTCRAGTIWRCDLDGTNLEFIAHNFRNQYEPCVDSYGTIFVSDNDDDGNQQTRICYVMPGGNYGYHPRGPGQSHWHEEMPGIVPKILRTGFGSPTGMCVYEGELLPLKYHGMPLHTDAGPREVRCYHLRTKGAGYAVETEVLLTSSDNWFRPSDVCVAPDGSVFVADWNDPGVGGHGMGDATRGRIYRLTPKGHQGYQVPSLDLNSTEGMLQAVASPNPAVMYMGIQKLQKRTLAQRKDLLAAAENQGRSQAGLLETRLRWFAEEPGLVRSVPGTMDNPAVQAIRMSRPEDLVKLHVDASTSPAIRREMLLALRDADPALAKDRILELAKFYDGEDRFYLNAIGIAVGHHDKKRRAVLLADFDRRFPEWNAKIADLVWELQPRAILPRLEAMLLKQQLPVGQRTRVVDILAASEDLEAGKTMLRLLNESPSPEVRRTALDHLEQALPGKWRGLRGGAALRQSIGQLLQKRDRVGDALTLVAAAQQKDHLPVVRGLALDGATSVEIRKQALRTLGRLPMSPAVKALEQVATSNDSVLAPLALEALGELVPRWSVRSGPGKQALQVLQTVFQSTKTARPIRQVALEVLSAGQPGGQWLIRLQERQQLPDELVSDVRRKLRYSPYRNVRDRALDLFPSPAKLDVTKLAPLAELAAKRGNAERGKSLMIASLNHDSRCMSCHMVRGVGGQIGPDLSMIGVKGSRENLYESLIHPSKAIADQYVNWQIFTYNGQVLSGLMISESETEILLRDANGKDTRIATKDIEEKSKLPVSIMPNDIVTTMTEDDLVDMVEYLATLKTPTLTFTDWHIIGPFDNGPDDAGLDQIYPPESKQSVELTDRFAGKYGNVSWQRVQPNAEGYLDLQALHAKRSDNIVSYLVQDFVSPKEQTATLLLGTDDGHKLWLNGKLVSTSRAHRAAQPEQERIRVQLKKGKNLLLLKIVNGTGPHGLYFTILSEHALKTNGNLAAN